MSPFFWNKRFLSLEKKGNASIFLIEKKAVGLQPLVAVLDTRVPVLEGSLLVRQSSASFEDDTWGMPRAAVMVEIAKFT